MTGSTVGAVERVRPKVAGIALTDLSAVAGASLWAGLALLGGLSAVERALALAPLVIVPLGLGLGAESEFEGLGGRSLASAIALQPIGAALLAWSLLLPAGRTAALASAAWVPVTVLAGLAGAARAFDRGSRPLDETLVDAGLAYSVVGAVALVLFHAGVTFWFEPVIVLLTAVHFHYAGFALPVVAGVTGRFLDSTDRVFRAIAAVILVGPAVIAVGISFSPLVEVLAVAAFTTAVAAFGGYVVLRVVPASGPLPGALLGASALALPASMVLALGYGVAAFAGIDPLGLDLSTMVSLHGTLNAYGFALLGVLGWRLASSG